ncbi:glycosyltransferase 8, partial [Sarracenia purpurea var. burkii]
MICGVQEDDILGRRHPGVRQHRPPVRAAGRLVSRGGGLLMRGLGQAVSRQGPLALRVGPPACSLLPGMLVFESSLSTYHDLLTTLSVTPHTPFAEQ